MSSYDPSEIACIVGATAGYGERSVLYDLYLTLRSGNIFALLGPNGAGKSTLIRLLTKTLSPRAGTVRIDSRCIGFVPQDIALYPWLTPRENCIAFAGLDGLARRLLRQRVERALALTKCEDVADIPVSKLSGGFQRRANIAVALMRAPRLLILDEPTAGLDADAKRVIRDIILGVRADGAGVLLVSHELDLIDAVADSVGILVAGRFVANAPVPDLMESLFAQARIVELLLQNDPTTSAIEALRSEGAVADGSARTWILLRRRDESDAERLFGALAAHGLAIRELRFREPTIADAYSMLTRKMAS